MPVTLTQLNIDEALRYMGCPPEQADPATRELAESCAAELLTVLAPRYTFRTFAVSMEEEGVRLESGLLLPGKALRDHLNGCDRAVLFCATLGARVDARIRRAQSVDMAQAFALDCCAAAAVEQVCDAVEEELQARFPGCYFPFRFSPGYGDLPLWLQNDLLTLLDAPRQVGLTASDSHILIPRKSVTAILGVSEHPIQNHKRSCLNCPAQSSCIYRKSGGHCGIS